MINNALRFALCALLILVSLPAVVCAQGIFQGISGLLDLNYNFLSTKATDTSGLTTKTNSNTYNPRFSLDINMNIFPNLKLNAGGVFEKNISIFESDDTKTKSTTTQLRPYINLTLSNPLYSAGIGYSRRHETVKTSDSPGVTTVNEDYNAILGWRPEGLPTIDVRLTRNNLFDEKRSIQDITTDSALLSARYAYKGLDVRYDGTYHGIKDKVNEVDTQQFIHAGMVTYSNLFFDKRVSLNTSYNITHEETETKASGKGGEVTFQIFPFAGLSLIDDTVNPITLDFNPALIDGNLTASSGINIGVPPPLGDSRRRQIGLDLLNVTEINQILVWVDRDLPPGIASKFSWELFISSDNLNWVSRPPPSVTFGPFQNRFEINFLNVNARYIKVVTKPLTAADAASVPTFANPDRIFVTELQAFIKRPAEEVKGKTTRTSHILYVDSRARILDIPTLFYELSYFFTRTDPSGQQRYTLSNGVSVNHRFSEVFSGRTRVAREDGAEEGERRTAYVYNASIVATPLKTLRHTLVYSGRWEKKDGTSTSNNSIFLQNNAALYKGIDIYLNGGLNFSTLETGQSQQNTTINFGTNLVPHRTMTINLIYSDTKTEASGGGLPGSSTSTRRGELNLSYHPFETLYLFASGELRKEGGQKLKTLQNFGLTWSPLPEGALQFNFFYNESIRSEDHAEERIISPSLRWKIATSSYLELSYQLIQNSSQFQKSISNGFGANLKIFF
jgi:hypothetical protein